MDNPTGSAAHLIDILDAMNEVALAVSGGVDSMTLAHMAMRRSSAKTLIFHAVSPAVPPAATQRVRAHANQFDWDLRIVGAGEFDDADYLANPLNRCYFCKSNLYARLRGETDAPICSGTNTDDLGDFRPGLGAAREQGVRHPFVEAGINKAMVRRLASAMNLTDLAEMPAQPCLSSRVETGLPIVPDQLALIDRIETTLSDALGPGDIRCRMTRYGVRIELPGASIATFQTSDLHRTITDEITAAGYPLAGVSAYTKGSAFLKDRS